MNNLTYVWIYKSCMIICFANRNYICHIAHEIGRWTKTTSVLGRLSSDYSGKTRCIIIIIINISHDNICEIFFSLMYKYIYLMIRSPRFVMRTRYMDRFIIRSLHVYFFVLCMSTPRPQDTDTLHCSCRGHVRCSRCTLHLWLKACLSDHWNWVMPHSIPHLFHTAMYAAYTPHAATCRVLSHATHCHACHTVTCHTVAYAAHYHIFRAGTHCHTLPHIPQTTTTCHSAHHAIYCHTYTLCHIHNLHTMLFTIVQMAQ